MKKNKIKYLHITVIIAGIIFSFLSIFHTGLWFDEAYSVGLADKSFSDIWTIGGNDVHPILYYWILHIIYLATNGSIIAYRVFSAVCISALRNFRFYSYKKRFWREEWRFIFVFLILSTSCLRIYFRDKNVFFSYSSSNYSCNLCL